MNTSYPSSTNTLMASELRQSIVPRCNVSNQAKSDQLRLNPAYAMTEPRGMNIINRTSWM
jgi:hypothetical protein